MKSGLIAITFGLVGAAGLAAPPAAAHHSFALYDATRTVTVSGTVTTFSWQNPHVKLELLVPAASGVPQHWVVEGQNVRTLKRMGWSRDTFQPGEKITLTLYPRKLGGPQGAFIQAKKQDGAVVNGRVDPPPLTADGAGGRTP